MASEKERFAISEVGTGFACAKLSEILPAARVARFVRMTREARVARFDRDETKNERPDASIVSSNQPDVAFDCFYH